MNAVDEQGRADFEALLEFVKQSRGFDFRGYKRPTLQRRIEKRMSAVGSQDFADYRAYLATHSDEYAALFDTILINVTSFFRDEPAWEYLRAEIVPRIVDSRPSAEPIRIWSTGCATGEEAYTIAMLFADAVGDAQFRRRLKIYATDVDEPALQVGRHGRYTPEQVDAVPEDLRAKYLERTDHAYVFRSDLRRAVIFGRHDLLQDPPISRIDLLLARNTLMYFTAETQARVLANFHFSLNDEGFLFLGKSEVLLTRSTLFVPVDLKRRVFAPTSKVPFRDRLLTIVHEPRADASELSDRTRETAFDSSPIPQFVVADDGTLSLANLQARLLFGLSARDVGRAFSDLELSYRPSDLRSRIDEVRMKGHPVTVREVQMTTPGGEQRFIDVHLAPLHALDGQLVGTTVSIVDVTRYRALQDTVERSKEDLETAYEELQAATEELETTNEELQSTNEELETTNEELQSTNEELETMNEELQSANEELETINDELRLRTDDLHAVNVFLDAILTGLNSGVAVLDHELRVRAWNAAAEDLWGLRADEAEGEHFLNLDIGLPVNQLSKPLREILGDGGAANELQVSATNRRGHRIDVKVRLSPIDVGEGGGVIVLMDDHEDGARPK